MPTTTPAVSVYTIGFTQSSAEDFFTRLKDAGVKRVIDIRLHRTSQLAGFAKADDLAWFLRTLAGIDYAPEPLFAPTEAIFRAYKKEKGDWQTFARDFRALLAERRIETQLSPQSLDGACLLCSEAKPHDCHRQIICDYLNEKWGGVLGVRHL